MFLVLITAEVVVGNVDVNVCACACMLPHICILHCNCLHFCQSTRGDSARQAGKSGSTLVLQPCRGSLGALRLLAAPVLQLVGQKH